MEFKHIPVLLEETIQGLNINPDGIYVDGTIGGAGHSKKIIEKFADREEFLAQTIDKIFFCIKIILFL